MAYTMVKNTIRSEWAGRIAGERFTLLQWLGGSERDGVFLTELQGPGSQKAAIKLILDTAEARAVEAVWAAAKALSHPHLMHLLQTGRCEIENVALLYAVTEYAEENLAEVLKERPLTHAEAREMLGPTLQALGYLHEKGFVHGHLKPSNVMVVDDQLRLSTDNLHMVGQSGDRIRKLTAYDAPEAQSGNLSPAADIFSLGMTLVEALTQLPPMWERQAHAEPLVPPSVAQPFPGVLRDCLRLNPGDRCTLSEIKARLEPVKPFPVPAAPTREAATARVAGRLNTAAKTFKTIPARLLLTMAAVGLVILLVFIAIVSRRPAQTAPSLETTQPAPVPEPLATAPKPQQPAARTQPTRGGLVKGAVAERVMPDVPENALRTIQGKFDVSVRVTADANGKVSNAALDTAGPSRYFARLTLQAARNWKFTPARVGGQAMPSVWLLRFRFTQAATEVNPVEVSP